MATRDGEVRQRGYATPAAERAGAYRRAAAAVAMAAARLGELPLPAGGLSALSDVERDDLAAARRVLDEVLSAGLAKSTVDSRG